MPVKIPILYGEATPRRAILLATYAHRVKRYTRRVNQVSRLKKNMVVKVFGKVVEKIAVLSMDRLLHRKINLLLHLAHIDGKFHHSEKELLKSLLEENGLKENYLEQHQSVGIDVGALRETTGKAELLYWVLKLIHVDGELHSDEIAFAKVIAVQLGYGPELIDHFLNRSITSLAEFEKATEKFQN